MIAVSTVQPGRCLGWDAVAGEAVLVATGSPLALGFVDYADLNRWIARRGARVRALVRKHAFELRAVPV